MKTRRSHASHRVLLVVVLAAVALLAVPPSMLAQSRDADDGAAVTTVPLRVDSPVGERSSVPVPITGGVPFPRGALDSVDHVRVLAGRDELPAQVTRTASWPDGSVKWALIDIVAAPEALRSCELEYGSGVERADVDDPVEVETRSGNAIVSGPDLAAKVSGDTGGLESLTLGGERVLTGRNAITLVLEALRTRGPDAYPGASRVCMDPDAVAAIGRVVVEQIAIEASGPIRARVLVRGYVAMPGWGTGLPDRVLAGEPAQRVPFSLRFSFWRGLPIVQVDHQLVYTGEPDRDVITRWGLTVPGQGAGAGRLVVEPGVTIDHDGNGGERDVVEDEGTIESRLCWAPLKDGFALIRDGWENRPCEIAGASRGDARIDFWPRAAGSWDLRRYARDWAVGETGNKNEPRDMERYAQFAARGLAKSHVAILAFGDAATGSDRDELALALAGRTLLLAPPGWYATSEALGRFAIADPGSRYAAIDAGIRRYIDYFRFSQEVYRWHGKLEYGFWQSRNGDVHRVDRWARDYGRWGWSLGDGAGRVGHCLMLAYLRTGERRFMTAGDAWCRAVYDTSMVHTERHLENATGTWWSVRGSNHRHNVQPFGCPYIGMRGSNPGGHRILYYLTGDGVIEDGLDIVAGAALDYATGARPGAFGSSGGSDGEGSGSIALLWKWETTGDERYRDACRAMLDKSDLIPPGAGQSLGYGPAFGLFLAAGEYTELVPDDADFRRRFLELAERALAAENRSSFITVLATAAQLTGENRYRSAVRELLDAVDMTGSLAELPVARWPGHGGWRTPPSRGNTGRDLPYAIALFEEPDSPGEFFDATPDPLEQVDLPIDAPSGWFRSAGAPGRRDVPTRVEKLMKLDAPRRDDGSLDAGRAEWTITDGALDSVTLGGVRVVDRPVLPYVVLATRDDAGNAIREELDEPRFDGFGKDGSKLVATGKIGAASFALSFSEEDAAGVPSMRIEMAVEVPKRAGELAAFGVRIPLALGDDMQRVHVAAAGRFRVERWRVDMNNDEIPDWLTSDSGARWPPWRAGGLLLGPGDSYRIYKLNRPATVVPLWVDQGLGAPGWLDVIDRTGDTDWGCSVRLLRDADGATAPGVVFDADARELRIEFHSPAAQPLALDGDPISGAADVIVHDGWRPPLGRPELSREQFRAMLDDLDYAGNIGLFALRFRLSETHKVSGDVWKQRLADLGIEPRDILVHMQFRAALETHARRLGVRYDETHIDETIQAIIAHYRS